MTALVIWDNLRAIVNLPDFWFGVVAWAGIIWAASKIGAPHP